MGKWIHRLSESSNIIFQGYVDRSWRRDQVGGINDELATYDLDLQHSFPVGKNNNIIWGAGYRFMDDRTQNLTQFVGLVPKNRKMYLFSTFVQDEISILPDRLQLTIGTKLQHNNFTGFELQPSARISITPFKRQIFWAAISRAVRTPSRIDVDYHIPVYPVPPTQASVAGGPNFISETVVAYEAGYRMQPVTKLSLSFAGFYNMYNNLFSVEPLPGTLTYQIQNGVKGTSYGFEFAGSFMLNTDWRLRGGYSYFRKDLENKPGNNSVQAALSNLGSDAKHLVLLQSILDLPARFQLDLAARYVGGLQKTQFEPAIESYATADARIGKQIGNFEISINGQNLLDKRQSEFGRLLNRRAVYGKLVFRY
jgi:iron complex outermembrane receptor protein